MLFLVSMLGERFITCNDHSEALDVIVFLYLERWHISWTKTRHRLNVGKTLRWEGFGICRLTKAEAILMCCHRLFSSVLPQTLAQRAWRKQLPVKSSIVAIDWCSLWWDWIILTHVILVISWHCSHQAMWTSLKLVRNISTDLFWSQGLWLIWKKLQHQGQHWSKVSFMYPIYLPRSWKSGES